jgi:hypothetical protein
MNASTRKTIAKVCKVFAILWLAGLVVFETRYIISVVRDQAVHHHYHILRAIYEEQLEGINLVLLIVFLIPSAFAWLLYTRFRREY